MTPTECPHCRADLRYHDRDSDGEPIEASRVISVYSDQRDRTTHWKCPDCGGEWPHQ